MERLCDSTYAVEHYQCPTTQTSTALQFRIVLGKGDDSRGALVARGCPQGGVLSPSVELVVDDLLTKLNSNHYYTIGQREVRAELQSLDVRKASGPDGIPAVVLKKCAAELSPVLTRLYQCSYSLGRVPETWRDANVQPVPKKGDRSDPANYRPIAVTSVLCKVLEKVLNNHLTRYLEDHSLINDRQYGFRPKRSTGDLLAYLTHIWGEAIDKRGESLAISLDIAKAFDRVWHKSLLSKLPAYGLPAQFCSWVADFLHERRIRVLTDGSSSRFMSVNAGVPQGSVLSPTLFLLHINDLIPLGNIHCYADDSTVHAGYLGQAAAGQAVTREKRENLVIELNQALDHISEWGTRNLVGFNAKKTQACAFTAKTSPFLPLPSLQGTTLPLQSNISMLGMEVRSDLNPKDYIETVIKTASRKLGVLNKVRRFFTPDQLCLLYKTQVRSCVEYCSHLWDGSAKYLLDALDRLQRRAIRIIGDEEIASPACTELEVVMLDWLGQMLSLPEPFLARSGGEGGGVIQGTASEATLVALLGAKARTIQRVKEQHPDWTDAQILSKLVGYCNKQAHSSVERAGLLGGVKLRTLRPDNKHRLRGDTLKDAIKEDLKNGLIPFYAVATLGTTSSCAFDVLDELGDVCNTHDIWLHVDAAYAGSAFICPEYRYLMKGVEKVDSFNFSPHKWMLVNFDCSTMWLKNPRWVVDAFNVDPLYLKHDHQGAAPDYRHWQIPLGRRFRALKLWFVLRLYGIENLQKHIRKQIGLAHYFEEFCNKDDRFEIYEEVTMGLVCFRLKRNNEINEELLRNINGRGKIHLVPSKIDDVYFLRFAICSRFTENSDIDLSWEEIKSCADEVLKGVSKY
ncbi:hypothetical protein evm_010173 [Chilo suppressalis]|nr:hypothetical protein evm_010173 [Chilo suppressalis]